jgi:hypothetical protein
VPALVQVQGPQGSLPGREVPGPRRVAHDCFTGQACGREVTVGNAPAVTDVQGLKAEIRRRLGAQAEGLEEACDEIVETTCRFWPLRHMANIARKWEPVPAALNALAVISAKAREDIEARYGVDGNTGRVLDLLCNAVAVELANVWFCDVEDRIAMRRVCVKLWVRAA